MSDSDSSSGSESLDADDGAQASSAIEEVSLKQNQVGIPKLRSSMIDLKCAPIYNCMRCSRLRHGLTAHLHRSSRFALCKQGETIYVACSPRKKRAVEKTQRSIAEISPYSHRRYLDLCFCQGDHPPGGEVHGVGSRHSAKPPEDPKPLCHRDFLLKEMVLLPDGTILALIYN